MAGVTLAGDLGMREVMMGIAPQENATTVRAVTEAYTESALWDALHAPTCAKVIRCDCGGKARCRRPPGHEGPHEPGPLESWDAMWARLENENTEGDGI